MYLKSRHFVKFTILSLLFLLSPETPANETQRLVQCYNVTKSVTLEGLSDASNTPLEALRTLKDYHLVVHSTNSRPKTAESSPRFSENEIIYDGLQFEIKSIDKLDELHSFRLVLNFESENEISEDVRNFNCKFISSQTLAEVLKQKI